MASDHPLLELNRLDSEADGLHKRRETLAERAKLLARAAEITLLDAGCSEAGERRTGLGREERRLEGELADLAARAKQVEERLYSGKVTAVKELEGLQLELDVFKRNRGELEDAEMVVLEQAEGVDGEIAGMEARCSQARAGQGISAQRM
jgi:predicted  nucleic acid-binding Zn-ribbon protein